MTVGWVAVFVSSLWKFSCRLLRVPCSVSPAPVRQRLFISLSGVKSVAKLISERRLEKVPEVGRGCCLRKAYFQFVLLHSVFLFCLSKFRGLGGGGWGEGLLFSSFFLCFLLSFFVSLFLPFFLSFFLCSLCFVLSSVFVYFFLYFCYSSFSRLFWWVFSIFLLFIDLLPFLFRSYFMSLSLSFCAWVFFLFVEV